MQIGYFTHAHTWKTCINVRTCVKTAAITRSSVAWDRLFTCLLNRLPLCVSDHLLVRHSACQLAFSYTTLRAWLRKRIWMCVCVYECLRIWQSMNQLPCAIFCFVLFGLHDHLNTLSNLAMYCNKIRLFIKFAKPFWIIAIYIPFENDTCFYIF